MSLALQILIAWVYGHMIEYCLHRFVLHNPKMLSGKPFKRHFAGHHGTVRKDGMLDGSYSGLKKYTPFDFETAFLTFLALIHIPVAIYSPAAYAVLAWSAFAYFIVHAATHLFPGTLSKVFPWHTWHHLGKNQNVNYGVRLPIIDMLVGTYKPVKVRNR